MQRGSCGADGWFDPDDKGPLCIAILIEDRTGPIDVGFWDPRSNSLSSLSRIAFAIGEEHIDNPGVTALGGALKVWCNPLEWLRAGRDGMVVLRPELTWIRLNHIPRIQARDQQHLVELRHLLRPQRVPMIVLSGLEVAA